MIITDTGFWLALADQPQSKFMEPLANRAFETFNLQPDHAQKIAQLMQKYANLPMDLADASLVILA